jgi:hypothetical protein
MVVARMVESKRQEVEGEASLECCEGPSSNVVPSANGFTLREHSIAMLHWCSVQCNGEEEVPVLSIGIVGNMKW